MYSSHGSRWNWQDEGFARPPTRVKTAHPVTLHRVWGGTASEMGNPTRPGVCFSFIAPKTRREAEGLFSVWEWGNQCRFVTSFDVTAGSTIFIGQAHPGDFYQSFLGTPGSQVFVEIADLHTSVRRLGPAKELVNDMGPFTVVPNRDPGKRLSS